MVYQPVKFAYRAFSERGEAEVCENGIVRINEFALGDPFTAFEYGRKRAALTEERLSEIREKVSLGDLNSHIVTAPDGVVQKAIAMLSITKGTDNK